jgi:hypothetical protein
MGVLSPTQSIYLAVLFPSLYVGSIYLRKQSRLNFASDPKRDHRGARIRTAGERWRDDDSVIKARLRAVCLSTFCDIAIVAWIVFHCVRVSQIPVIPA